MAGIRDIERFLNQSGYSPVRMDSCNRGLREAGRIPSAGRGLNAAQIDTSAAAALLLAYQGCTKAVKAVDRLRKLEGARSADGKRLLAVMRDILEGDLEIAELRISRLGKRARLVHLDGSITYFSQTGKPAIPGRAEVEGVIDGLIFANVGRLVRGEVPAAPVTDESEDAE